MNDMNEQISPFPLGSTSAITANIPKMKRTFILRKLITFSGWCGWCVNSDFVQLTFPVNKRGVFRYISIGITFVSNPRH